MKAYLVIRYDLYPYFVLEKCNDTGKHYEVGSSYREYSSPHIIRRVTEKTFKRLQKKVRALKSEARARDSKLRREALNIARNL